MALCICSVRKTGDPYSYADDYSNYDTEHNPKQIKRYDADRQILGTFEPQIVKYGSANKSD